MKNRIVSEFQRLTSLESSAEAYQIFFRLVQVFSLLGLVYFLLFVLPFWLRIGFGYEGAVPAWFLISPTWNVAKLVIAELALRAVKAGKVWGTYAGITLSASALLGPVFLLGIFGFFAFLNASFQEKYLANAPESSRAFLGKLNLRGFMAELKK